MYSWNWYGGKKKGMKPSHPFLPKDNLMVPHCDYAAVDISAGSEDFSALWFRLR